MTRVKICGITDADDARDAALLGADAVGLNFCEQSPRVIEPEDALRLIDVLPPFVSAVGVFVNYLTLLPEDHQGGFLTLPNVATQLPSLLEGEPPGITVGCQT